MADDGSGSSSGTDTGDDAATRKAKAVVERDLAERQAKLDAITADPAAKAAYVVAKKQARAAHEVQLAAEESSPEGRAARKAAHTWPTGLFEDPEAPVPSSEYQGINRWVGPVGDDTVAVHAGVSGEDASTGRLFILWQHRASHQDEPHGFVDRPGSGPLRIVGVDGSVVVLEGHDQARHRFDLAAGSWLGA